MSVRRIIPIVEGYGEERAVPCLLRRWFQHRGIQRFFDVPDLAINAKGCGRLKAAYNRTRHTGVEHYIEAALRSRPDAILVVLDADEECINRRGGTGLGPELLTRAKAVTTDIPLAVVVADREYEAWFLANFRSFRDRGVFPGHARLPAGFDPASHGDCKGWITRTIERRYEETVDQFELTRNLRFSPGAITRSLSYGKLLRDLERLTREMRKMPVK